MKKELFVCLAAIVLIAWTGNTVAQQGKVPPEVWEKAKTKGVVRVIVELNLPTKPVGTLSKEEVLAQQQAIAGAQNELLAELSGTKHRVTARFKYSPGLALEVGTDGLAVLERSAHVVKVTEERVGGALLQDSVPLVEADQAWAAGFDGTGWTVAVLDTGWTMPIPSCRQGGGAGVLLR